MKIRSMVSALRCIGNALLLTALLLISSGCTSAEDEKIQKAIAEADRVAANEPMRAVAIVDTAMEDVRSSCPSVQSAINAVYGFPCRPGAREEADAKYDAAISKARLSYLAVALERKDAAAIEYLFFSPFSGGDARDLRRPTAAWILSQLEAQARLDPRVQRAAAHLLAHASYGTPDTKRALHLLKDAWLAGVDQAAGDAAQILYDIHDLQGAYMWSLRCRRECLFAGRHVARDKLSKAELLRAEEVARDSRQVDMSSIANELKTSNSDVSMLAKSKQP